MPASPFEGLIGASRRARAAEAVSLSSAVGGSGPFGADEVGDLRRSAARLASRLGVSAAPVRSEEGGQRDGSGRYVVLPSGLTSFVQGVRELAARGRFDVDEVSVMPSIPSTDAAGSLYGVAFDLDRLSDDDAFVTWATEGL